MWYKNLSASVYHIKWWKRSLASNINHVCLFSKLPFIFLLAECLAFHSTKGTGYKRLLSLVYYKIQFENLTF